MDAYLQPQIVAGRVKIENNPTGDLVIRYQPKEGAPVECTVQASQLERWAMRLLREQVFAA